MPIYEYKCTKCAHKFDLLRPSVLSNEPADCPKCKEKSERILIASFACRGGACLNNDRGPSGESGSGLGGGSSCGGCSGGNCSTCH